MKCLSDKDILANLGKENRGTQHISISLVFQKLLTGHGTQHMSQKAGCPAKNGTVDKYVKIYHKNDTVESVFCSLNNAKTVSTVANISKVYSNWSLDQIYQTYRLNKVMIQ